MDPAQRDYLPTEPLIAAFDLHRPWHEASGLTTAFYARLLRLDRLAILFPATEPVIAGERTFAAGVEALPMLGAGKTDDPAIAEPARWPG